MNLAKYRGEVDHMMSVAAAAGFAGIEPEVVMLGVPWDGDSLRAALDRHGLILAALTLVCDWREEVELSHEREMADAAITAVAAIPGAVLNLVQYPGTDRADLGQRQRNAFRCMRDVARRAADQGVLSTFHPNSPPGSAFRTAADYDFLLNELDPLIGFTPDAGHIAAGGMDPVAIIRRMGSRVKHVHIKDIAADGTWAATGEGVLDIIGVVDALHAIGYEGWIAFEDESDFAARDPDAAVMTAGRYIDNLLAPRDL